MEPATAQPCTHSPAASSASATYAPDPTGRRQTEKPSASIRTLLNGWAYAAVYRSSNERTTALDGWLWHYNHQRRHSALGHQPPASRTNVLGSYT
jgi:transposase InsO family protein